MTGAARIGVVAYTESRAFRVLFRMDECPVMESEDGKLTPYLECSPEEAEAIGAKFFKTAYAAREMTKQIANGIK